MKYVGDDYYTGKSDAKTVTSTLGNEIDVTPSSNHSSVNKNPGPYGKPNTSVDILDANGNVKTRRWYDSDGKAHRDVDMSNHGNPKEHPEVLHEHTWEYNNGKPDSGDFPSGKMYDAFGHLTNNEVLVLKLSVTWQTDKQINIIV